MRSVVISNIEARNYIIKYKAKLEGIVEADVAGVDRGLGLLFDEYEKAYLRMEVKQKNKRVCEILNDIKIALEDKSFKGNMSPVFCKLYGNITLEDVFSMLKHTSSNPNYFNSGTVLGRNMDSPISRVTLKNHLRLKR